MCQVKKAKRGNRQRNSKNNKINDKIVKWGTHIFSFHIRFADTYWECIFLPTKLIAAITMTMNSLWANNELIQKLLCHFSFRCNFINNFPRSTLNRRRRKKKQTNNKLPSGGNTSGRSQTQRYQWVCSCWLLLCHRLILFRDDVWNHIVANRRAWWLTMTYFRS